ncbi:MAG: GIY-YIG nuclease family protein [Anaerolineales bacterium]
MVSRQYFVYILSSRRGTLYTGVTNDLTRRLSEHRRGTTPGFTSKYRIHRLIYFETTDDVYQALAREKQIKAWSRREKLALIRVANPRFRELLDVSDTPSPDQPRDPLPR